MQAIVYHTNGPPAVLNLEEVQKPVAQNDEVLVSVLAASAAAGDWHLMRADPFLRSRPGVGSHRPAGSARPRANSARAEGNDKT